MLEPPRPIWSKRVTIGGRARSHLFMDVRLVIFKSDGSSREIPVSPGRYVIGRKPNAGLRIPLPSVSRDHCELVHDGRTLSVRDLGSSNGTFKNQERIKQATLGAGDRLGVGAVVLTIQIDGKPSAISRPVASADDEDDLMDTPVGGVNKTTPVAPEDSGLHETVTKSSAGAPSIGGKATTDDSSIFEFDFDFEDDDRPKL